MFIQCAPIRFVPLFRAIASKLEHLQSLGESFDKYENRFKWTREHYDSVRSNAEYSLALMLTKLPSGSGIDSGTLLDESSKPNRLVFTFGYHHMNDAGFYDGWTDHSAIVTPSLTSDFDLRITGRNRSDIKEYLQQTFDAILSETVDPYEYENRERFDDSRYARYCDMSRKDGTIQIWV